MQEYEKHVQPAEEDVEHHEVLEFVGSSDQLHM